MLDLNFYKLYSRLDLEYKFFTFVFKIIYSIYFFFKKDVAFVVLYFHAT